MKLAREGWVPYDFTHVQNLNNKTKQKQTQRYREQTEVTEGRRTGDGREGEAE